MARLNYHHLYYFWRVATQGNLTQTANALHVSQSALSSQIRQLENSMGTALFLRSGRKLTLTESGHRVLAYASDIFSKGEELESLLANGLEPAQQLLRIGMLSTMSRNFVEGFIQPLLEDSKVRYSLHAKEQTSLLDGLASHQLDVVLTNIAVHASSEQVWQCQLLAQQPISVVGPTGRRFSDPFPKDYDRQRWVLPVAQSAIRSAFDGFCALYRFEPDILAEADDMAMLRLLARDSNALTVLPRVVVRDEIRQRLLVEYMTLPNVYENFYAVTIKRQFTPAALGELLSHNIVVR